MPTIKKTKVEFEGRIEEREVIIEEEKGVQPWGPEAKLRVVGHPTPRVDGAARVTGQARYTQDIQWPGMLVGRFMRSPRSHARITSIDRSAAEAMPGVWLVWDHNQLPPIARMEGRDIFQTELAYEGSEVAFVVADDERIADDAVEAIKVEYEDLPFVYDITTAMAKGAPPALLGEHNNVGDRDGDVYNRGSLEQGIRDAEETIELTFTTPEESHCCLETHGSVCQWEGDQVTTWHSTQGVFSGRRSLADALDIPIDKVRCICEYVGGGFGSKVDAENYTLMAALAARQTGRPVKVLLDRHEEHLAAGYRPSSRQRVRLGARKDGTLTFIEQEIWVVNGAYGDSWSVVGGPAHDLYACPNVHTVVWAYRANTDASRAFRAPGYVEGTFAFESAMDAMAKKLGIDPLQLRLKNYAEVSPQRNTPYTTKGLRKAYQMGAERIGWATRESRRAAPSKRPGPWKRGWGMASQIWGGGGGPPAKAVVKLLPDATAEVAVGVQDLGTGTKTALAQVAAEELGLPLENIRVIIGDTLSTPYGPTSGGSVTLASTTPAVRAAARDALYQLLGLAPYMLNLPAATAEDFRVENGRVVFGHDPTRWLPFHEVAAKMGNYMIVGDGARGPNPEKPVNTFGAQFCEVEVNVETGQLRVNRVVAAHEVGRIVNPLLATSQVNGGVIQALGFGATEGRVYDRQTGLQLTANLEDYRVPTIGDAPEIEALFVDEADPEANSVGSKGLGEPPIIPLGAALANAVADAIGVRLTDLPLTPDRILEGLRAQKEALK